MTGQDFATWVQRGRDARARGDHAEALTCFEKASATNPRNIGLRLEAAAALREMFRFDEAEAICRKVLADEPRHFGALFGLGHIARKRGDRIVALERFQAASDVDPTHIGVRLEVATDLRELSRLDEAEMTCQDVLRANPRHVAALTSLGYIARRRGDRTAALERFRAACEADPAQSALRLQLVEELRELSRFDEAEAICRELLGEEPLRFRALVGLGKIARKRGDRTVALERFQAAADVDAASLAVRLEVATELRELSRLEEAEAIYRNVLGDDSGNVGALIGLAQIARRREGPRSAVRHSRAAHAADAGHVGAALELAIDLRALSRLDEAEAVCRALAERNPRDGRVAIALAQTLRRARGRRASLPALYSAVETADDPTAALLEAAQDLKELSRHDEAEGVLLRVLDRHPRHAGALLGLGQLARRQGRYELALARFREAVEADAGHVGAKLETIALYRDLGRYDEADDLLGAVHLRSAHNAAAWIHKGHIARRQGERSAALEAFRRALAHYPGHAGALVEIAVEEKAAGRPEAAESSLLAALEIQPDHLGALSQLVDLTLLGDSLEEALTLSERLRAAHPGHPGGYAQGARILMELGRREDAVALLDRAAETCGPHQEIAIARVAIFSRSGEWTAASDALRVAVAAWGPEESFTLWAQGVSLEIAVGAFKSAGSMLEKAPQGTQPEAARVEILRGELAEAQWRLDEAAGHYLKALAIHPELVWLHSALARVHLLRVDLDQSIEHLREMVRASAASAVLRGQSLNLSQNHVGQLLDEFALDREARERLAALLRTPAAERIEPLRALVRDNPDLTSAAVCLLVSLRQAGKLRGRHAAPGARIAARIPRRLFQYWNSRQRPAELEAVMRDWRDAHHDAVYTCFDDSSAGRFLRKHFSPEVDLAFRRSQEPAKKADILRLACLYALGGFYADADDRCLGDVSASIPPEAEFVAYQEEYGTLGNNFIGASPGHPVIARALRLAVQAVNRGDTDILWLTTGPGLLTRAFAQDFAECPGDPRDWLSGIVVLERHEFRRIVAPHMPMPYKRSTRHWLRSAFARKTGARAAG